MAFPFEQLQVYQVGLRWVEDVESIDALIKEHLSTSFRDQLKRAVLYLICTIGLVFGSYWFDTLLEV